VTDSSEKPNALTVAPADASESTASATDHDDVALIHGRTDDGKGLKILRRRQDRLEVGAVVPLIPGKPIVGEVVRLEPRKESPLLCNVHVEYTPPNAVRPTSAGPAQVANARYRENWEQIFGKKDDVKPVLN
jgi:hypothetical protein